MMRQDAVYSSTLTLCLIKVYNASGGGCTLVVVVYPRRRSDSICDDIEILLVCMWMCATRQANNQLWTYNIVIFGSTGVGFI